MSRCRLYFDEDASDADLVFALRSRQVDGRVKGSVLTIDTAESVFDSVTHVLPVGAALSARMPW